MKRALLPGFDPLPHALSTKGLSALVAIVVLGTGFMVQRYVESSQTTSESPSASQFDRPSEVRAAESDAHAYGYVLPEKRSTEAHPRGCGGWRSTSAPHARAEATTTQSTQPTLPSMFQPEGESVGG